MKKTDVGDSGIGKQFGKPQGASIGVSCDEKKPGTCKKGEDEETKPIGTPTDTIKIPETVENIDEEHVETQGEGMTKTRQSIPGKAGTVHKTDKDWEFVLDKDAARVRNFGYRYDGPEFMDDNDTPSGEKMRNFALFSYESTRRKPGDARKSISFRIDGLHQIDIDSKDSDIKKRITDIEYDVQALGHRTTIGTQMMNVSDLTVRSANMYGFSRSSVADMPEGIELDDENALLIGILSRDSYAEEVENLAVAALKKRFIHISGAESDWSLSINLGAAADTSEKEGEKRYENGFAGLRGRLYLGKPYEIISHATGTIMTVESEIAMSRTSKSQLSDTIDGSAASIKFAIEDRFEKDGKKLLASIECEKTLKDYEVFGGITHNRGEENRANITLKKVSNIIEEVSISHFFTDDVYGKVARSPVSIRLKLLNNIMGFATNTLMIAYTPETTRLDTSREPEKSTELKGLLTLRKRHKTASLNYFHRESDGENIVEENRYRFSFAKKISTANKISNRVYFGGSIFYRDVFAHEPPSAVQTDIIEKNVFTGWSANLRARIRNRISARVEYENIDRLSFIGYRKSWNGGVTWDIGKRMSLFADFSRDSQRPEKPVNKFEAGVNTSF